MAANRTLYPEIYQGAKEKENYFEGWYFRHLSSDKTADLIVIPGISKDNRDPHAFIQIISGSPAEAYYIKYKIADFKYSSDEFNISIGENNFNGSGLHLNINNPSISLKADIKYGNLTKIDRKWHTPNIMGLFGYLTFMECNHGVISLTHSLTGKMSLNGKEKDFSNGSGYIEKDWGTSFPKKYIWMQSNQFQKDTSLFLSIAQIPFLGMKFIGLISILTIDGKQYRFATYNGSKFKITAIGKNGVSLELTRGRNKLIISADNTMGHVLKAPRRGSMTDEITETLNGTAGIQLYEKGKLTYEDSCTNLGLEIVWPYS